MQNYYYQVLIDGKVFRMKAVKYGTKKRRSISKTSRNNRKNTR